jgi:hypothetical protein
METCIAPRPGPRVDLGTTVIGTLKLVPDDFVPPDFTVPRNVVLGDLRLEPLGPDTTPATTPLGRRASTTSGQPQDSRGEPGRP